jgi:hypothetical protein
MSRPVVTADVPVKSACANVAGSVLATKLRRYRDLRSDTQRERRPGSGSRSAVLAGWQCLQGVELGPVQGDVGRGGVGGDLLCSFGADDRRGDRRAG